MRLHIIWQTRKVLFSAFLLGNTDCGIEDYFMRKTKAEYKPTSHWGPFVINHLNFALPKIIILRVNY